MEEIAQGFFRLSEGFYFSNTWVLALLMLKNVLYVRNLKRIELSFLLLVSLFSPVPSM